MGNITTGAFFSRTYQTYRIAECVIGATDCSYSWRLTGTLAGVCLQYDPNEGETDTKYSRETQLRITIRENDTDCTSGQHAPYSYLGNM